MNKEYNSQARLKGIMIVASAIIIGISVFSFLKTPSNSPSSTISNLLARAEMALESGQKVRLVDHPDRMLLMVENREIAHAVRRSDLDTVALLKEHGLTRKVELEQVGPGFPWSDVLRALFIFALIALLIPAFILIKQRFPNLFSKLRENAITGQFTSSRHSRFIPSETFEDVAGIEYAKRELMEIVTFLKEPERFRAMGARSPRGVLLAGPTGTGKTLLARAVAGEAGVPFYSLAGSQFVEMFVGVGASRVRDLFAQAKRNPSAIIFIDEIDSVGRARSSGASPNANVEQEQALNQMLVEMDGFTPSDHVIVIGATNRPDMLDKALLRPGRFDQHVHLDLPDQAARLSIIKVHARNKPLGSDVNLEAIAHDTRGFAGAGLAFLVNRAAIEAVKKNGAEITRADFDEAYERLVIGALKDSVADDKDILRTAVHELGHAIVGHLHPLADPVEKVSVIARGHSGGHTRQRPENESKLYSRAKLEASLAFALGGLAAEKIFYQGDASTGPSSDLEVATERAWEMVCTYGMDDELGPMVVNRADTFTGNERTVAQSTREQVDKGILLLLRKAEECATDILQPFASDLEALAKILIAEETMDGVRLTQLVEEVHRGTASRTH